MQSTVPPAKVPFQYNARAMAGLLLEAILIFIISGFATTGGMLLMIPYSSDLARPFVEWDDNASYGSSLYESPVSRRAENERQLQDVEEFFDENGGLMAVVIGFSMAGFGVITAFLSNALAWFIGREVKGQGDFYPVVRWSNRLDVIFIPLSFFGFFLFYYWQAVGAVDTPLNDVDPPNILPLLFLSILIPIGYLVTHTLLLGELHKLSTARSFGVTLAAVLGGQQLAGIVGSVCFLIVFFFFFILLVSA